MYLTFLGDSAIKKVVLDKLDQRLKRFGKWNWDWDTLDLPEGWGSPIPDYWTQLGKECQSRFELPADFPAKYLDAFEAGLDWLKLPQHCHSFLTVLVQNLMRYVDTKITPKMEEIEWLVAHPGVPHRCWHVFQARFEELASDLATVIKVLREYGCLKDEVRQKLEAARTALMAAAKAMYAASNADRFTESEYFADEVVEAMTIAARAAEIEPAVGYGIDQIIQDLLKSMSEIPAGMPVSLVPS
jgi:hypothetical protein